MINIGALNTIIAVVIVLLLLSLIVQSIQSLIKKIFKMKSNVFLNSIVDLFEYVDSKTLTGKTPQELVDLVKEEFRKLGRETLLGNVMFDSISKEDFLKIVDKIVRTHPEMKAGIDPKQIQNELRKWFETVMQGFNERYTRHMKSTAVVIAFVLVVILNANFFSVYRNIATSDMLRARILSAGSQLQKPNADENTEATKVSPNRQPTPRPTASSAAAKPRSSPANVAGTSAQNEQPCPPELEPCPSPAAARADQRHKEAADNLKENAKEIQDYMNDYKGFGFAPLRPQQVSDFLGAHGVWQGSAWSTRSAHGAKVLLGWLIMTVLLSVGAPFWQDALESLFGLKGLIRKKGETKNVEEGEGGQEKP